MIPKSVKYLLTVDLFERYSFYSLKAIIVVFFINTFHLTQSDASFFTHIYLALCFITPIIGGYLLDEHFTKYKYGLVSILGYSLAFLLMCFDYSKHTYLVILLSIACCSGMVKPLIVSFISDNVKDLDESSQNSSYDLYYLCINIGAIFAMIFSPMVYQKYGMNTNCVIISIAMFIAFLSFIAGRKTYKIIEPTKSMNIFHFFIILIDFKFHKKQYSNNLGLYIKDRYDQDYLTLFSEMMRTFKVLVLMSVYYAIYEVQYSTFIIQGLKMKQKFLNIPVLANQIASINPVVIIISIHCLSKYIYTRFEISFKSRMLTGLLLTALGFAWIAVLNLSLITHPDLSVCWQIPAYLFIAIGEVMIYSSALQLFFGGSSEKIKSTIGGLFFLTIFFGNLLDAFIFKVFHLEINTAFFTGCSVIMSVVTFYFSKLKIKEN